MSNTLGKSVLTLAAITCAHALAAPTGESDEAMAVNLVKVAIARLNEVGPEKAFFEFRDIGGMFNTTSSISPHDDLYILGYQKNGVKPVDGKNLKVNGKNVLEMRDPNGVYLIKEKPAVCWSADCKGWVRYVWTHSITKEPQDKKTYVERSGDYCLLSRHQ